MRGDNAFSVILDVYDENILVSSFEGPLFMWSYFSLHCLLESR